MADKWVTEVSAAWFLQQNPSMFIWYGGGAAGGFNIGPDVNDLNELVGLLNAAGPGTFTGTLPGTIETDQEPLSPVCRGPEAISPPRECFDWTFVPMEMEPPVLTEKEEFLDQCLQTLFGCTLAEWQEIFGGTPDKADIVAAIQAGLGDPGDPEPSSSTGTIIGTFDYRDLGDNSWNPATGLGELGPANNPSCDPDSVFGALVVDLNIPAGASGSASTTFTVEDASAGWGATYIYDKGTNTILAQTYPPGAGGAGNTTPVPFDHTISYTIPAGTDPTDICLVINAFGSAGSGPFEGTCDEIGPGETIVTVSPAECGPALDCFEEIFGCSLKDLMEIAIPGIGDDDAGSEGNPKKFVKGPETCAGDSTETDLALPWQYQMIWAEENGALNTNQEEYSFGAADPTVDNGIALPFPGEIVGLTLQLRVGSADVQAKINDADIGDPITVTSGGSGVLYYPDPVAVNAGDTLDFVTKGARSGANDAVITAIYRFCVDPCVLDPGPGQPSKELAETVASLETNQVIAGYAQSEGQIKAVIKKNVRNVKKG